MLKSKKNNTMGKVQETESAVNIIGNGTEITGDIKSNGDIRIDGKLDGNLSVTGKLVIGPTGFIKGDIYCKNADVSGTIQGKIEVVELLTLKASAKVHGDIVANKIAIDPGAIFTGTCKMDNLTNAQNSDNKNVKKAG